MAYDTKLAERIRAYLKAIPGIKIEEKKMFRGLTFMINGKMCVSVSGENFLSVLDLPKIFKFKQRSRRGLAWANPSE